MSRILSRISMLTGQISSHALHDVHAQSSSEVMRSNTESAVMVMPFAVLTGGDTTGSPVAAITSPTLSTISRGSSGFPVACAGHTDAQRLGEEPGERDDEERQQDDRVLGLGLDADPVGALEVPPGQRPQDADGEDDAGEVGRERVPLVHAAVQELEVVGELVVELQH